MLDDRVQGASMGSGCCPKQPLVMVYAAVLSYFSVAFMGLSTLPAWLQSCVVSENPDATPDEVAAIYGSRFSAFTFVQGTLIALVAGWAGALSDRFGRRRCAALPAIGQAVGSAVLAVTAYYELDWRVGLAGWAVSGALGGPLVFLAAAFAYIADWTPQEQRGRAFAGLEGAMLYVSAVGPLLAGRLVQVWGLLAATEARRSAVGFAGLWGTCAAVYAVSPVCFALAQPSPQVRRLLAHTLRPEAPPPDPKPLPRPSASRPARLHPAQVRVPPAPCVHWLRRSTPVLVGSLLCEGRGGLNRLCAAFVLALSSSAGGVSAFLLYAQRFLDWEEGKIGLFVALFAVVTGTMILFNTIVLPRLLARCCARPPPHDLSMVRAAFLGPPAYLLLLYLAPYDAREAVAFCGIPLLGCGACALPHFRALFSAARPVAPRGQNAVLVAPQLTALAAWGGLSGILAALRTWEELPGRLGPNGRLQRGRAARPKSPILRSHETQAERQGETMAMVAALESIPQMVRHRVGHWAACRRVACHARRQPDP